MLPLISSVEIISLENLRTNQFQSQIHTNSCQNTSGSCDDSGPTDCCPAFNENSERRLKLTVQHVVDFLRAHRHYLVDCEHFVGTLLSLAPQLVSLALSGDDIVGRDLTNRDFGTTKENPPPRFFD